MTTADRQPTGSGEATPSLPTECAEVRGLLPLRGGEAVQSRMRAHLERCAECRAEAEFVNRIGGLRTEPPASILRGVMDRAEGRTAVPAGLRQATRPSPRAGRRFSRRSASWTLSVAAAVVLALGVGIVWNSDPAANGSWDVALDPDAASWYAEEWIVAGGPVPEALTDDMLITLLEEMDQ